MNNDRKLLEQALNLLESEWPEGDEIAQPVIDAIREALAEQEITTPDVCGEVCARAKLCYGCGKAFDEALAEPVKQDTPYCKSVPMCTKPCGDESCVEPVTQEPLTDVELINANCRYTTPLMDETVKQEPVACPNLQPVINWLENGCDPKEAAKELRIYQDKMKAAPVKPVQEPVFWYRPINEETYEGPVHNDSVCGKMWRDEKPGEWLPLYAAPVQPVKQEPVAWVSKRSIDWLKSKKCSIGAFTQTCLSTSKDEFNDTPLYADHILWTNKELVGRIKLWTSHNGFPNSDFEVQLPNGEYEIYTDLSWLYAAPVDAKAIRAEALEEAAKVCEGFINEDTGYFWIPDSRSAINDCAAAIRGLK